MKGENAVRRSEHVLSAIRGSLPALSIVICVLQPLLDVLSYWQIQLELPNYLTLGVRLVMIGLMLLAALPLLRNKDACEQSSRYHTAPSSVWRVPERCLIHQIAVYMSQVPQYPDAVRFF